LQIESSERWSGVTALAPEAANEELPLDLRAGIECLADLQGSTGLLIDAVVIGQPSLVASLARYGAISSDSTTLIALNSSPASLHAAIEQHRPDRIVVLGRGRIAGTLAPFRRQPNPLVTHLTDVEWRSIGYEPTASRGFFGPCSVVLILLERMAAWIARPDLSDRIRVARQNAVAAWRRTPSMSTVLVREYRAVR
jgi:hypothetical protein